MSAPVVIPKAGKPRPACPACGKPLEPDALKGDRLWCSLCAINTDLRGEVIAPEGAPPAGSSPSNYNAQMQAAEMQQPVPSQESALEAQSKLLGNPPQTAKGKRGSVTISMGKLSLRAQLPFTFEVGGQEVTLS